MGAAKEQKHAARDRKAATKTPAGKANDWKGFVNCELSDADKVAAKAWRDANADTLWERVFTFVEDGYKLSFSIDAYNNSYVASLTCRDKNSAANGLTLTARGGTLFNAAASLAYKHLVILADSWGDGSAPKSRDVDEDDMG